MGGWGAMGGGGREVPEGGDICLHMADSLVQQKLTQHCKATILQSKKKKKEKRERCQLWFDGFISLVPHSDPGGVTLVLSCFRTLPTLSAFPRVLPVLRNSLFSFSHYSAVRKMELHAHPWNLSPCSVSSRGNSEGTPSPVGLWKH